MSLAHLDHQQNKTSVSSNDDRRGRRKSSLIVNLSTLEKRSSLITTKTTTTTTKTTSFDSNSSSGSYSGISGGSGSGSGSSKADRIIDFLQSIDNSSDNNNSSSFSTRLVDAKEHQRRYHPTTSDGMSTSADFCGQAQSPHSAPAALSTRLSYDDDYYANHNGGFATTIETTTPTNAQNVNALNTPPLQVVEVKGGDLTNEATQYNNSPEPIVEVESSNSSASSSPSPGTPNSGQSPISSRQSSDCDDTSKQNQQHQQHQQHQPQQQQQKKVHSSSRLTSSSTSSSSRLIRRRTVRRSYHHRETEESCQQESGSKKPEIEDSLVVSTTTSNGDGDKANCRRLSEERSEIRLDNNPVESKQQANETRSHFRTRQIGSYCSHNPLTNNTNNNNCINSQQQQHQQVSRIAKCTSGTTLIHNKTSSNKVDSNMAASKLDLRSIIDRDNGGSQLKAASESYQEDITTRRRLEIEQEEESRVHHHRRHRDGGFSDNEKPRLATSSQHISSATNATAAAAAAAAAVETTEMTTNESMASLSRRQQASSSTSSSSSSARLVSSQLDPGSDTKRLSASSNHHRFESSMFVTSSSSSTSSSSHRHSSTLNSGGNTRLLLDKQPQQPSTTFLSVSDNLFTSPDVRSLVRDIGTDFAELELALANGTNIQLPSSSLSAANRLSLTNNHSTSNHVLASSTSSSLSTRLFGSPLGGHQNNRRQLSPLRYSATIADSKQGAAIRNVDSASRGDGYQQQTSSYLPLGQNGARIRELMDKVRSHEPLEPQSSAKTINNDSTANNSNNIKLSDHQDNNIEHRILRQDNTETPDPTSTTEATCKAVMSESIERIDQRMSELCSKLDKCQTTDEAIDLLKIMIQMVEKAWSVPVCGDDLGFKLCNSLRNAGGLDIILGFINEADDDDENENNHAGSGRNELESDSRKDAYEYSHLSDSCTQFHKNHQLKQIKQGKAPLKLSLSKLTQQQTNQQQKSSTSCLVMDNNHNNTTAEQTTTTTTTNLTNGVNSRSLNNGNQSATSIKDNDSDILTSDLGLDSTSVESLPYQAATPPPPQPQLQSQSNDSVLTLKVDSIDREANEQQEISAAATEGDYREDKEDKETTTTTTTTVACSDGLGDHKELQRLRKEELVFLSARLLSQCLTSENRDYIVKFDLDPVIRLACNYTTMKSILSKRLLMRSSLKLKASPASMKQNILTGAAGAATNRRQVADNGDGGIGAGDSSIDHEEPTAAAATSNTALAEPLDSDIHSAIGTEILQHLFKHSEETCSTMISLGGLQAILYGCRSSNIETLRHCASALANLALYGGSDSQQTMIEQKAHVWLFPLAFNEDDNVQYYACLAIVVLAANQEIEADVLKSSTLDLVEPFVTSHEPRKFAESTTSHIHGQSANWLKKLIPLLDSKREEARNLACFHFAMEAYIKREQGQTQVFKDIGAIESLRRAGSSPIAIASKFACQALRLIGEKEPHKLSQQVPLWTCDDVCEWVNQIGFDNFKPAFRESHVDGDLLLQLDNDMLKNDIGIENGIIRRRFLRELSSLKRIADYSSVDKSNLGSMLIGTSPIANTNSSPRDFIQYIYPILQMGVTRENIHLIDCEQLLAECKISNAIHRMKLAQSIKELQDRILIEHATSDRNYTEPMKTLDCFVSYRRSTGSQLASLLKVHLQLRGFSVFIDVERLEAGKFDNNLLDSIKTAKNFILVLSQNALDRCIGDHECKDWVHKEIVAALSSNCNIIPIMDNFQWPDADQLPEDMRSIPSFNSVRWIHDYQDACVDKLERFIRGDWPSMIGGGGQQTAGSIAGSLSSINLVNTSNFNQRSQTNVSTPSIVATPSIISNNSTNQLRANSNSFSSNTLNSQQQVPPPPPPPHPSESDSHPLSFVSVANHHLHHLHKNMTNQQQQHSTQSAAVIRR